MSESMSLLTNYLIMIKYRFVSGRKTRWVLLLIKWVVIITKEPINIFTLFKSYMVVGIVERLGLSDLRVTLVWRLLIVWKNTGYVIQFDTLASFIQCS